MISNDVVTKLRIIKKEDSILVVVLHYNGYEITAYVRNIAGLNCNLFQLR